MKNAPDAHYKCAAKLLLSTQHIRCIIVSSKCLITQHLSFDNLYTELNVKLI